MGGRETGGGGSAASNILSKKLTIPPLTVYNGFPVKSGGASGYQVQAGSFVQMKKLRHREGKGLARCPRVVLSKSSLILPRHTVKGTSEQKLLK